MGIAQTALDPPLSNGQMWKKVPQTILASLYTHLPLTDNTHMETTHFKKGLPILTEVLHIEEYNEKQQCPTGPRFWGTANAPAPAPTPSLGNAYICYYGYELRNQGQVSD